MNENPEQINNKKKGRPLGSTNKLKISDFMTYEQMEEVFVHYLAQAQKDNRVLLHLVDQLAGKAKQQMELTGDKENPVSISISEIVANKYKLYDPNESTSNNSSGQS